MKALKALPLLAIFVFFTTAVSAQDNTVATLKSVEGTVEVRRTGEPAFAAAAVGTTFAVGDMIKTARSSRAGLAFANGGFLRLGENTSLEFKPDQFQGDKKAIGVNEGKVYYFSRNPQNSPRVETSSATMAIRGTEFALEVAAGKTQLAVLDGRVDMSNKAGQVSVASGEQALVEKGKAPVKMLLVKPLDAVQWALYYPELPLPESAPKSLQQASFLISRGDIEQGERALQQAEAASARLSGSDAARIRGVILAERAVIALAKNDQQLSQTLSDEAVQTAPGSPAALLARSYVTQSLFRLDEARDWTRKFIAAAPSQAVGYARLAELEMGAGELDQAIEHAGKAVETDPDNAYAQTVYGFSALLRSENEKARESFTKAAALDPSLALAQLGAGLTRIHQGALSEGRQDLEQAAFLSPNVAVYRSYLGKAYFEEEDEARAGHEYNRAISLDPLDPTPYLYRAFNQLSANDPVGALRDVERSIELNNNRAVYRSSLLLDQDLGVRSAGLAKVFTELGFARAAQIEAIKSINRDYSNYSAHQLLADSYDSIFSADASESERRITRLLAPLSFNLFQQQAGAATLSEYDALFDRPDRRTELGIEAASYHDLLSPYAQHAAKGQTWAYAVAEEYLMTDGSKDYNFGRRNRASLTASYQPSYKDRFTLSGESIYDKSRDADREPEETRLEEGGVDVGYLHSFDTFSKLLLYGSYTNNRNRYRTDSIIRQGTIFEIMEGETTEYPSVRMQVDELSRERVDTGKGGAQYVLDLETVSAVSGFEYDFSNVARRERSGLVEDEEGFFNDYDYVISTGGYNELTSSDIYTYTIWHLMPEIDLTLGGSYTFVEFEKREVQPFVSDTVEINRFNPKLGLVAYPVDGLTLRGAYFEGLRKSILEDPITVEPTLVGGFNQIFNDLSGARARNVGVGADYKLSGSTYLGLEGIARKVRQNIFDAESEFTFDYDAGDLSSDVALGDRRYDFQNQEFVNGYVSRILSDRVSTTLEWNRARFESTDPIEHQDVRFDKLSLNTRYFDPSGFFPFCIVSWREQEREGGIFTGASGLEGISSFWTADAGIGYRLPKRHGSVALQVSNIFGKHFTLYQDLGVERFVNQGVGVTLVGRVNF